jgi:hypothetical protein
MAGIVALPLDINMTTSYRGTHRASFDNILTSSLSWLEFWYGGLFLLTSKGVVGSFKKKKKKKDMHSPVALIIENMSV